MKLVTHEYRFTRSLPNKCIQMIILKFNDDTGLIMDFDEQGVFLMPSSLARPETYWKDVSSLLKKKSL